MQEQFAANRQDGSPRRADIAMISRGGCGATIGVWEFAVRRLAQRVGGPLLVRDA